MTDTDRTKIIPNNENEVKGMIDMARKDNKGRNLKTGEYQRPDGRYEYRYKDEITGKRNSVYAANLASLREMEKKINKDMDDLLITDASVKKLTVNTLFERYMATKNIKERTKKNYIRMWDYRIRNTLGNIRVLDFKTSHVRTFFSALSDEGLAHSTIKGLEGYCFHDSETKTDAGIRDIPMTQMVYDAFRKQRELNLMLGLQSNVEIGGRSGFIFNTKHGRPIMPAGVNSFLKNIVNAYNKKESKLAEEEKREPELMPPISSHTLRHTGCTRLGENNVNPKVMQYVMGHSDAQITMNVYNHIAEKSHVENEMSKMNLPETVPAVV